MNPQESEYLYGIPKSFSTRAMHSCAGQVEYDNPNLQEAFPLWMKKLPNEMRQVTPNWKKRLYELENKYINDTRKSMIADVVEHVLGSLQELQDHYQQNKKQEVFVIVYFVITLAPDQVLNTLVDIGLNNNYGPGQFLGYLSYLSNHADSNLEWYLSSAPFSYVLSNTQLGPVPTNYTEIKKVILNINQIFQSLVIEFVLKIDPNQAKLKEIAQNHQVKIIKNRLLNVIDNFPSILLQYSKYNGCVNAHLFEQYQQKGTLQLIQKCDYQKCDYQKCGNSRTSLEECIANLEHSKYCITFSSGYATMSCIINLCQHGEQILCCDDVCISTQRYFKNITVKNYGMEALFISDSENVSKAITNKTKLIWIESSTSKITDIQQVCKIAKQNNILTIVDNTFATPYLQTPSDLGADITVNLSVQCMDGHQDFDFGSLTCNDKVLYDKLLVSAKQQGECPSGFNGHLLMMSLKTLELRVKQATRNAYIFAQYLESSPFVEKVLYPGLQSHPQHELVKKQQCSGGFMINFYIKGGLQETKKLAQALKIFKLSEQLGGVESLIEIPSIRINESISEDDCNYFGIQDNLVRVAIGIENVEDLIDDMEQALKASH